MLLGVEEVAQAHRVVTLGHLGEVKALELQAGASIDVLADLEVRLAVSPDCEARVFDAMSIQT